MVSGVDHTSRKKLQNESYVVQGLGMSNHIASCFRNVARLTMYWLRSREAGTLQKQGVWSHRV